MSTLWWPVASLASLSTLRWARRRRQVSRLRDQLRVLDAPASELYNHLTAPLKGLVRQARNLRHLLEAPVGELSGPPWAETPWGRRARCAAWDLTISELRRAVWDWRRGFGGLAEGDVKWLEAVGVRGVPLSGLLMGEVDRTNDPWEQVLFSRQPDPWRHGPALRRAAAELLRFERALTVSPAATYRQPA